VEKLVSRRRAGEDLEKFTGKCGVPLKEPELSWVGREGALLGAVGKVEVR